MIEFDFVRETRKIQNEKKNSKRMLKWSRIEKVPKYREDQIEMDRSAENV